MREWFLFIFIPSFYFFCWSHISLNNLSVFHSDSPNDPSRVSHTDCPARINSQKNGLNLLFLSHYDAFPTLLWNIRVGQDNIRDGFLTRGVAIRVCLNECVARVILTAVIILSQSGSVLPIVLGHDPLLLLLLFVQSPMLLERLL